MTAPTMIRGRYHWRHGIFFQRNNDVGDVTLTVGGLTFDIPAAQWCSILASVSNVGESGESYAAAEQFHG